MRDYDSPSVVDPEHPSVCEPKTQTYRCGLSLGRPSVVRILPERGVPGDWTTSDVPGMVGRSTPVLGDVWKVVT